MTSPPRLERKTAMNDLRRFIGLLAVGRPRTAAASPTSQGVVMNPTHRTRRLSVMLAGLAAAALALPAGQGTATAASHQPPHHHAAQAAAQQTQNGLTVTDIRDLANMKRDLFQSWRSKRKRA
jgi:hypothetical protein